MQNCKRCFTLRVAFYIVYAGLQPPSSKHGRLLPFWYLSNRVMGKLPECDRTNDEQSGVSTKIPKFWNGRHVVTSYGLVIKSDNDPGLLMKYFSKTLANL